MVEHDGDDAVLVTLRSLWEAPVSRLGRFARNADALQRKVDERIVRALAPRRTGRGPERGGDRASFTFDFLPGTVLTDEQPARVRDARPAGGDRHRGPVRQRAAEEVLDWQVPAPQRDRRALGQRRRRAPRLRGARGRRRGAGARRRRLGAVPRSRA